MKKSGRAIIFIIFMAIFSFAASQRNILWKDSIGLWKDSIKKTGSSRAYNNLGVSFVEKGDIDEAIKNFETAKSLGPSFSIFYNLGGAYGVKGFIDKAIEEYLEAVNPETLFWGIKSDYKEGFASAHYRLGLLFEKKGMIDEAVYYYEIAAKLNPKYYDMVYKKHPIIKPKQ